MTSKHVNLAGWLTTLPSLFVVVILLPALALAHHGYVPQWAAPFLFPVFVASVPIAFLAGGFGLVFAAQSRLSWPMRIAVMVVHLGALAFAGFLAYTMLSAFTAYRLELH